MEITTRVKGLREAADAIAAAFPGDRKTQRKVLNQAMSAAAKQTIVPMAKQLALQGDGSGALSEAIGVRQLNERQLLRRRAAGGIQIVPLRSNRKAMGLYIAHYYVARGQRVPAKMINSGIRHGHLVEWGFKTRRGEKKFTGRPFMGPAAQTMRGAYATRFTRLVRQKIQTNVRRARRKAAKR